MPRTYTVKKGDELNKLAEKWGISISSLLAANTGVSSINPGVKLSIPNVTLLSQSRWAPEEDRPPKTEEPEPGTMAPFLPYVPPKPYVPPPPASGDYGPKGYPKEPGTQLPPDVRPPPYVPPPYLPSRVPVGRGAQPQPRADLSQYNEARRQGAQPTVPQQRQGLIPGALRVAERVAPFLQRLFNREPLPTERRPGEPTAGARFTPIFSQEQVARGFQGLGQGIGTRLAELRTSYYRGARGTEFAEGFPKGSFEAPGPATLFGGAGGGIPDTSENAVNQVAAAQAQGQERGVHWYRMLMGEGREDRMFAYVWDEKTPQEELLKQRAGHVADSLNRGDFPQIILESDRRLMKYSREDMLEIGYVWDEDKQHWVFGGAIEEPQTYGAASLPGWGYNYPPQRGGGGGGSYSYPSYLPRKQEPFPQSFVGREQPGGIPQQAQTRAARFGAITWRI